MKKKSHLYYDENEIDLIELFKIIWDGKKKVLLITLISFLVGFGYSYQLPNNYLISLSITKDKNEIEYSNFINKLKLINKKKDKKNFTEEYNFEKYRFNVIKKFNNELKDYEEFLFNLKNTKKVKENISKLPLKMQKKELFKYADLLKIEIIKDSEIKLNFKWDNIDEAEAVLQNTINSAKNNLEKLIYKELDTMFEMEKKLERIIDSKELNYLKEQRWIAKELNISNPPYGYTGVPYYYRGHIAIDKEIEFFKIKGYQNFEIIKKEMNFLAKEFMKTIYYDIDLAKVKLVKNTKLILLISVLFGLFFGVFFVLILNKIQSQTIFKKRTK